MILFLQYSFTDLRSFIPQEESMLTKPTWPTPIVHQQFFRGTGMIVNRSKKGLDNWIGEHKIVSIQKQIRFSQKANEAIRIKNVGKHFYATENMILSKYEFVFTCVNTNGSYLYELKQLIDFLLSIEVKFKNNTTVKVGSLLKKLKKDYLYNSTKKAHLSRVDATLIKSCMPQIFISMEKNEVLDPGGYILSSIRGKYYGVDLRGGQINNNNRHIRLWINGNGVLGGTISLLRAMRMSVLRLHSEYACLINLLEAIRSSLVRPLSMTQESDALQSYLNRARRILLKEELALNDKLEINNVISLIKEVYKKFTPGETEALLSQIEALNFRRDTYNKIYYIIMNVNSNNNISQSPGAIVGNGNTLVGNEYHQNITTEANNLDFEKLKVELAKLKEELMKNAKTAEEIGQVTEVAHAEEAAQVGNGEKVLGHLKNVGKWVGDIAIKLGIAVTSAIIAAHLK